MPNDPPRRAGRALPPFFAAAALLFQPLLPAIPAFARDLDTAGIPATAKAVFFVDAAPESPFGSALREIALRKLSSSAGIVPAGDTRGLVIAILPSPGAGDPRRGVLLLRGNFDFPAIFSEAEKRNARTVDVGGRKFVDAGLAGSLPGADAKAGGANPRILLGKAAPRILVLADAGCAGEVVAAFDAPEKAWRAPESLGRLLADSGSPLLLGVVEQSLFSQLGLAGSGDSGEVAPSAVRILFSEASGMLRLELEADFLVPEDARRVGARLKTLFDLLVLEAASDRAKDDRPQSGEIRREGDLLLQLQRAAQFLPFGKTLRITAEFPVSDALKFLRAQAG
ncbi:MAG: hypothetical protein LBG65_04570 [Puniceicoccales bacterium]|jgi:hypothetical protein|nr:hypothetical protein [Puniceicoccales bacterium]